jgi:hypothetical protein
MASDLQRSLYRSPVIGALRHVFTTCAVSWSAELQTGQASSQWQQAN